MKYLEFTLYPKPGKAAEVCEYFDQNGLSYSIDDAEANRDYLEGNRDIWDYADEEVTAPRPVTVKVYPNDDSAARNIAFDIGELINDSSAEYVDETDWENNWKPYYKPIALGENLCVVPEWTTVIRLNPGMLFGTGGHATTGLCLEAAERHITPGCSVLDLGCGSGILSIAALLLGAESAAGYDIDPHMPDIANANARLNSVAPDFVVGDVRADNLVQGSYGVIFANLVADLLIDLADKLAKWLAPGGTLICSGIIEGRQSEVQNVLTQHDFKIAEAIGRDGWWLVAVNR
ncbi:MAG: 50S ribosomal protein L11 methyltransferase [Oscillospiraceae bacterium]|jgi:ribosomal protein L11 methyltransferase|nr:50S ribosomal protein L11 methyltransferase [Oscillospiraceae bacterium]